MGRPRVDLGMLTIEEGEDDSAIDMAHSEWFRPASNGWADIRQVEVQERPKLHQRPTLDESVCPSIRPRCGSMGRHEPVQRSMLVREPETADERHEHARLQLPGAQPVRRSLRDGQHLLHS